MGIIAVVVVVCLIDTTAASSPNRQRDFYYSDCIYHEQDPYLTACLQDTGVVPNILIDFQVAPREQPARALAAARWVELGQRSHLHLAQPFADLIGYIRRLIRRLIRR